MNSLKTKMLTSLALVIAVAIPARANLINNSGIDGPAADSPIGTNVRINNTWNSTQTDAVGKWWTGIIAAATGGHSTTGGNPDGRFFGDTTGFINRLQIIDNSVTQASGPHVFSVDRQWYDDDPLDSHGGSTFLGVKWRIFGFDALTDLPGTIPMLSGSGFGNPNAAEFTLLAEYNKNDINGAALDGDMIADTGASGTGWHTQQTPVDLGASAYNYLLVVFRAGSVNTANFADIEVPISFDNVTLNPVPEPCAVVLFVVGLCGVLAESSRRRRKVV